MDERPLRADARRNRARVLEVAAQVFATEGVAVPVHEIARRAGVGTGTVSRHFPTKDDLVGEVLFALLRNLVDEADALAERADPGTAFFAFVATLVRVGAANRALAQELAGTCCGVDGRAEFDVPGRTRELLAQAQQAGAVRADITYPDVKALMTGCMARRGGPLEPVIGVVCDGLRTGAGHRRTQREGTTT